MRRAWKEGCGLARVGKGQRGGAVFLTLPTVAQGVTASLRPQHGLRGTLGSTMDVPTEPA